MRLEAGVRLFVNCDDIVEIWDRFPGLDPVLPGGEIPPGMLTVSAAQAEQLASRYGSLASELARRTAPLLPPLAAAWDASAPEGGPAWSDAADALAAGLGLGLSVLREVQWREPAAFCLETGGGRRGVAGTGAARGEKHPPFLRFAFLPGGAAAGIGLLTSNLWPRAEELVKVAAGRDFAQTLQSYTDSRGDMVAYGAAGAALRAAGVLVRSGVGLQVTTKPVVPVLTRERLALIAGPWRDFVTGVAGEVSGARSRLEDGLTKVLGGEYPPGPGTGARAADYLDAAYAVLADMVYAGWRDGGALAVHAAARRAMRGLLPWSGRGPGVRALLLENPAAIWDWLLGELRPGCAQRTARP